MYKTYTKYIRIYESALPQHPSLISLVFWQCRDSNLWLLRLSLAAYSLGRVLVIDGTCSIVVCAARGLTAGSGFATIELRVMSIEIGDAVVASSLHATLTLCFDDATIEAADTHKISAIEKVAATRTLVRDLIAIGMEFSPIKHVVCASSVKLGQKVVDGVKDIMIKQLLSCVALGTGITAGKRRTTAVQRARISKLRARKSRFHALKRCSCNIWKLLQTGGTAALTSGQAVMGASNTVLVQRRTAASFLSVTGGGADLDISFALADGSQKGTADPAFAAHWALIKMWSLACWEGWLPDLVIQRLWQRTITRLAKHGSDWRAVFEPAAATISTIRRIGWTTYNAFQLVT